MSDERLRDLERRWKETGDPQHGAAWLHERVRVGELKESEVRRAAHLGDQAASQATGLESTWGPRSVAQAARSALGLGPRILHALAEAVLPAWEEAFGPATGMEVIAKGIRSHLAQPDLRIEWVGLFQWAAERRLWVQEATPLRARALRAAEAIERSAEAMAFFPFEQPATAQLEAAVSAASLAVDPTHVREHLLAQVTPSLLEGRDPLAERPPDLSLGAFWSLIAVAREEGGEDGQADRLTELLAEQSFSAVIDYELHFGECFWRAYREDLWDAAFLMNGGCSDDGFTDFRYGLIGQGSAVYEAAIADPDTLSSLGERAFVPNESLGYAGWRALETKCGSPDAVLPQLVRGWYPVQELVRTGSSENYAERFPKLWALFSENVD